MTERTRRKAAIVQHSCGDTVITGLDGDRAALVATCDPYPLTQYGEVMALRDARRTYFVLRGELDPRDRWNITGKPADMTTVVAEHRCGFPIPADWRKKLTRPTPRKESTHEWF